MSKNIITVYARDASSSLPNSNMKTYNFFVTYDNLWWQDRVNTTNIRYFRSYVAYDAPGAISEEEVTDSRITFLWNATITSGSLQKMPFQGQSGSFVIPLTRIPANASKIYVGYQFVDKNGISYPIRIESGFNKYSSLESVTSPLLQATGDVTSGSLALTDLLSVLNSYKANTGTTTSVVTVSSQTFMTHRSGATPLILFKTPSSGTTMATSGRWFSSTPTGSATTFISDTATGYAQLLTKIENFSVPGFNRGTSTSTLTKVNGGIKIDYNCIPIHPYGTFPLVVNNVTRNSIAGMLDANNEEVVPKPKTVTIPYPPTPYRPTIVTYTGSISGTTLTVTSVTPSKYLGYVSDTSILVVGAAVKGQGVAAGTIITAILPRTDATWKYTVSKTQTVSSITMTTTIANNPLTHGDIGFTFNGLPLYAAIDDQGLNPIVLECGDLFGTHPSPGDYHGHFISPALHDFVIDYKKVVIGFAFDGYPIVRNYLIDGRPIQSSDLNLNHGVEASISFTLNGTTLTYDFYYVATLDFPYTIASYRGQAAMAQSELLLLSLQSYSGNVNQPISISGTITDTSKSYKVKLTDNLNNSTIVTSSLGANSNTWSFTYTPSSTSVSGVTIRLYATTDIMYSIPLASKTASLTLWPPRP